MNYSLGIDVGSVNAHITLIDNQAETVYADSEKIATSSLNAVNILLERLADRVSLNSISSAGYSGPDISPDITGLGWARYSSSSALASGVLSENSQARTIIYGGGQTALIVELEDGLNRPWKAWSNPLCAAGTGRFLEQQAYRLGISLEDLSSLALSFKGSVPRIATRCSVFAKSDLIHLQQKGVSLEAMLCALCESIARMVTSLKKGEFREPVYFTGGLAANRAVGRALENSLSARNGHPVRLLIPGDYLHSQSKGLALLAANKPAKVRLLSGEETAVKYHALAPFPCPGRVPRPALQSSNGNEPHYLGVDIGSTSTKAAITNSNGEVILKDYLMTAGRPVDAVKQLFTLLLEKGAGRINIAGAGVTGSGRYLVGSLIGADLVKNEITAQVRAARELDPDADIIEIGGQDSKLVIKRNGVVVDYQMNKACAAGTGSFIDELADMLGVSVKNGGFARLALGAGHTIDLGTRCAAFMGQAVATAVQQNTPLNVITASLADSIAKNYLSKVVGSRKLGAKVILTGAVFYNEAVVASFNKQLGKKTVIVAGHREVSGAIGAALLAKESMPGKVSAFKGFDTVIESDCRLSSFVCTRCDNNCTITRMQLGSGQNTYFGSRCDLYDASLGEQSVRTPFDERERLLVEDYRPAEGTGPTVGIPRALMVYDYAPLLIGFLNHLGVRVTLSGKTTKHLMEKAIELSYSDSCFPMKLLHGHIDSLSGADFILYPCFIRLGQKHDDANQKYACPLVQASPFIVREVLQTGCRILSPIVDLSLGEKETIDNFARTAVAMGFSYQQGKEAAIAGLKAQSGFTEKLARLGQQTVEQLKKDNKTGVVIISRSYMSQDAGANLGIAEKLARLGVVPVPLDFLPLDTREPSRYSDRPYWSYESKFISAVSVVTREPLLYSLAVTNFGCGPDSFILKVLEDISGPKPIGQMEIDEHAAEAGLVTRLEAFVDTISEHARFQKQAGPTRSEHVYRGASSSIEPDKPLLIPHMAPHAVVLAAAMQAFGVDARVLPEADESDLLLASELTSGTECLPYRVTLGSFLRFFRENPSERKAQGFMSGSFGPCRLGKYAIEQERLLKQAGFEMRMCTTVSNNAYRDLNLGSGFERLAWKGIVAVDHLERLLWHTRPYTHNGAEADRLFEEYLDGLAGLVRRRQSYNHLLRQASAGFACLINPEAAPRPLVGINGEIFLRANRFANSNLVRECEKAGLEVVVSPMSEWLKYTTFRNIEDSIKDRDVLKTIKGLVKKRVQLHDESSIAREFASVLDHREPSTEEILAMSADFLSPRCGSEAVLSLGSGLEWMKNDLFAGVISVMPHGCMPGGIVAAMAENFSSRYRKPWISLTYDGFLESNNLARITNFAEILKFCTRQTASPLAGHTA